MRLLQRGSTGPDVIELQRQLRGLGHESIGTGGELFDARTEAAVRDFQKAAGLPPDDGVVGPLTDAALVAALAAQNLPELREFRGGLGFLLREEGHAGRPYWPGGHSGLTLDPGFDLGQNSAPLLQIIYGRILPPRAMEALRAAIGARGEQAEEWVSHPRIASIRIERRSAALVLPRICAPRWIEATLACPPLLHPGAPRGAHTALLSLAFNAGPYSVGQLRAPAVDEGWRAVADRLRAMHPNHPGLSARRHREADLILADLPG